MLILCGDYNIAHTKDDIKNWRSNQKTLAFSLKKEMDDKLIDK